MKVSAATVSRYLARAGLVTPDPAKRPRSSYLRFEADMPNECWQSDFTHYPLAGGTGTEILSWLDDHSRYALSVTAHARVTGPIVLAAFRAACARHGVPASTLTDNGMVFTTRLSGGKGGRNGFEYLLAWLGICKKNGAPGHPQTQGKVERFQQTLKRWLARRPAAPDLAGLQAELDTFRTVYNEQRPHRAIGRRTPATAYAALPKARPVGRGAPGHFRLRYDTTDGKGAITLRRASRMHHLKVGAAHPRTRVLAIVDEREVTVVALETGEILSTHRIEPDRGYWRNQRRDPGRWPGSGQTG